MHTHWGQKAVSKCSASKISQIEWNSNCWIRQIAVKDLNCITFGECPLQLAWNWYKLEGNLDLMFSIIIIVTVQESQANYNWHLIKLWTAGTWKTENTNLCAIYMYLRKRKELIASEKNGIFVFLWDLFLCRFLYLFILVKRLVKQREQCATCALRKTHWGTSYAKVLPQQKYFAEKLKVLRCVIFRWLYSRYIVL